MVSSSSSSLVRPKSRSKKTTTSTTAASSSAATSSSNSSAEHTKANTAANSSKNSTRSANNIQAVKPPAVAVTNTRTNKQQQQKLTHSNTDAHCLPEKHNRLQHWLYLARLYNGFYMLTAREQFFCHIAGWMVAVMAGLYCYVFVRGFMDGFQQHLTIVEAA